MKIFGFREFRFSETATDIASYLSTDLKKILREIQLGFSKLTFDENFEALEKTVTIAAGAEEKIQHKFGVTPRYRVIVRSNSSSIVDGDTAWDANYTYLKNTGATSATVTVIFFK